MQKFSKYILIIFFAVESLTFSGCKKYFDLDKNPNLASDPVLSSRLTTATYKSGMDSYSVGSIVAPYVQYTANPSVAAASDTYQILDFSSTWDALYYAMADIYDMKTKATAQNSSEYIGVADVLLAYHLGMVNDLWGSAPYTEAFKGTTFTPKYDADQDLYKSCTGLLDEAITQLTKTDATIKLLATSDLIYVGDRTKWLKMAYALKARLLNKISKTSTYDATAVLQAVSNSFTSNADDAGMATFQLRNPWAGVALSNASLSLGGWLSNQLIDQLNGTTYGVFDPRIRKITDTTITGKYIGTVSGAGNRPPGNNTVHDECYISETSTWTGDKSPVLIITYAEVKFIEAEAAFRANDRERAYTAYLTGINANMDKLQVPASDPDRIAYLASPAVSVGVQGLTLDLIFKEKYIATYLNPEAWNDARRFDYKYKNFSLPVNAVLSSFIRRVDYTVGERSKNGTNVPKIGSLLDRLWWDK
ncbi:SusD/RagB family nutrient-binding outer membrane lipoprotein [Mucilaginibacter lappiensis]|uniref:SusD/RagB family nutrient-binding outer membrane lipoprotein n=1 Tax=Mucilaginibacter lappiensis TaxID=354630 RepID=UPI003D20201F